jgi:hypothetical protein
MRSGRQPDAAFGAAGFDDQTTTTGSHAGAETVGPLAMNDAGLESALHEISLNSAD